MNWKSLLKSVAIHAIVILLIFGAGFFTGRYTHKCNCPEIKDTVLVKGDSILVPYPVETIRWLEKKPALQAGRKFYQIFDSLFVSNNDTIGIKAKVEFNDSTKEFTLDMDIQHRDYDFTRVDTLKIKVETIKEIETIDPIWVTTTITSTVLLLISLLALLFGG